MHFDAREKTYKIGPKVFGSSKIVRIDKAREAPEAQNERQNALRKSIIEKKIKIFEALQMPRDKKSPPLAQEYSSLSHGQKSSSNYSELKFDNRKSSNPSRGQITPVGSYVTRNTDSQPLAR